MFHNKTAVITGAGSGIGRALALGMVERGCHLALSDINTDGLEETAELCRNLRDTVRVTTHTFDVSDRDAFYSFAADVLEHHASVDIVINNAGVALSTTVHDMKYDDLEWIFGINFWGVVYGTKAFLPHMMERGDGYIVNISSVFGLIGVPTQSAYNATKFAVRGFTESLRQELADTDIVVSSVHPGGVRTNIARASRINGRPLGIDRGLAVRSFDRLARLNPQGAATIILDGMAAGQGRILVGTDAAWIDILQRMFPESYGSMVHALRSRLLKPSTTPKDTSADTTPGPARTSPTSNMAAGLTRALGNVLDLFPGPHVVQGRRLDPQLRGMLHLMKLIGHDPLSSYTPAKARRQFSGRLRAFEPRPHAMANVFEHLIPADHGTIPARVYVPTTLSDGPAPIMVWFHGGGFVIGDLDTHDSIVRLIAHDTSTIVVAVDYRLAPEHPFPAAWDDAIQAFREVQARASQWGGRSDLVAVGGDSAGGNLSAAIAQATHNEAPPLFQLLICPGLDMNRNLPSHRIFNEGYLTDGALLNWFLNNYIPNEADKQDPRASPLLTEDLSGLAPALIYTSGYDPLQDDGEHYAQRLRDADVPTTFRCFHNLIHDFALFTGLSTASHDAMATVSIAVRDAFATYGSPSRSTKG